MGEHLKHKFEHIQERATDCPSHLASNIAADVGRFGKEVKDAAVHSFDVTKEELGDLYKQGEKKVGDARRQMQGGIRAKPLQSVLIATAVGLAVGFAFGMFGGKSNH
ncbi:MAG: hypothetical protein K8R69_02455 [Deltaproteobacteria bacterium]|nr:hypothetical protein [Deltaproteobacteria bacterium]